uniref:SnRNP core Sm protein Sm-X5-like protein n=1 Tax=Arundo donax TaxID=35708 RepID=A0A0A9EM91_ARUDO
MWFSLSTSTSCVALTSGHTHPHFSTNNSRSMITHRLIKNVLHDKPIITFREQGQIGKNITANQWALFGLTTLLIEIHKKHAGPRHRRLRSSLTTGPRNLGMFVTASTRRN